MKPTQWLRRIFFYALLPLLLTFLYFSLQGLVPGRSWLDITGDPTISTTLIKWHGTTLFRGDLHFADPPFYYPYKRATYFTETFLGPGLLLSPVHRASPGILHTAAVFLAHASTLAAALFLFGNLVRSRWAALLAAMLHTFNYTRVHIGYAHLHILYDAPALFGLALLWIGYRSEKPRYLAGGVLLLMVQFYFSVHLAFFYFVLLVILGALVILRHRTRFAIVSFVSVVFVLTLFYAWASGPYRRLQQWSAYQPPLESRNGATLSSLVLPPWGSIWHRALDSLWPREISWPDYGAEAFPGYLLLGLFLVSLTRWRRTEVRASALMSFLGLVAMLGPRLRWTANGTGIVNPMYAFYTWFPALHAFRVPQRWYYVVTLWMAMGAAWVVDNGLRSRPVRSLPRTLKSIAFVMLLLLFMQTDARFPPPIGRPQLYENVHTSLRPGDVVAELPMFHPHYMIWRQSYWTMIRAVERGFHTLDGMAAVRPPVVQVLARRDRLDAFAVDILRALGVNRIVLHCHDYRRARRGGLCGHNRRILEQHGYHTVLATRDDILLAGPERPPEPRIIGPFPGGLPWRLLAGPDAVDPGQWHLELRLPVFYVVLYPRYCIPIVIEAYDADGKRLARQRSCIVLHRIRLRKFDWTEPVPAATRQVRLGFGPHPRVWLWSTLS